jgi:hypothetical protein
MTGKERLADLPAERNALVGQAADWFASTGRRIPTAYLEKDFWVTEVLRSLAAPLQLRADSEPVGTMHARVVFKGGTSLSKAHGLIERFSEDVDLYVVTRFQADGHEPPALPDFDEGPIGKRRADRVLDALARRTERAVGRELVADDTKAPRAGTRRAYRLHYAEGHPPAALRPHVLIELTRMGNPEPNAAHELRSLINEYVIAARISDAEFAEFEPITIDVLMPHRTLVEKLCALEHCAQTVSSHPEALTRMARHFYDIHQLLGSESVLESLAAEAGGAEAMAGDHVTRSAGTRRQTGPRPAQGFGHSFWLIDAAVRTMAEKAYQAEVPRLAFGPVPAFGEVCERVLARAELL